MLNSDTDHHFVIFFSERKYGDGIFLAKHANCTYKFAKEAPENEKGEKLRVMF